MVKAPTSTVRPTRSGPNILYNTSLTNYGNILSQLKWFTFLLCQQALHLHSENPLASIRLSIVFLHSWKRFDPIWPCLMPYSAEQLWNIVKGCVTLGSHSIHPLNEKMLSFACYQVWSGKNSGAPFDWLKKSGSPFDQKKKKNPQKDTKIVPTPGKNLLNHLYDNLELPSRNIKAIVQGSLFQFDYFRWSI